MNQGIFCHKYKLVLIHGCSLWNKFSVFYMTLRSIQSKFSNSSLLNYWPSFSCIILKWIYILFRNCQLNKIKTIYRIITLLFDRKRPFGSGECMKYLSDDGNPAQECIFPPVCVCARLGYYTDWLWGKKRSPSYSHASISHWSRRLLRNVLKLFK